MGVLKKLFIVLTALIVVLVIAGQFLDTELKVERSTSISASKLAVFGTLSNLEKFNTFSPWHELDPNTQYTYGDLRSGVGASMKWVSDNPDVGTGEQRIVNIIGAERVELELEFDGWDGISKSWYQLDDVPNGTQVTWGYSGDVSKPFFIRFLAPMIQGQLETQYDEGLAKLKRLHESKPQGMSPIAVRSKANPPDISREHVDAQTIVFTQGSSSFETGDIANNLSTAYQNLMRFVNINAITVTGNPLALDTEKSKPPTQYVFEAALPVAADTPTFLTTDTIGVKQTYAGSVIKAIHTGSYQHLANSYASIEAYIKQEQLTKIGPRWEHYISDPGSVAEEDLITHIYVPIE